ncbi:hypothetical protein ABGB16_12005 [Micromonospora sp. B11E3]|uniref:hypothetical protein n=1 Tax=Micromonospora sp. B11E3 TaxID=3153562 RepID=UPI00325DC047
MSPDVVRALAAAMFVVVVPSILIGWTAVIPLTLKGRALMPGNDLDTTARRSALGIRAILRDLPPGRRS